VSRPTDVSCLASLSVPHYARGQLRIPSAHGECPRPPEFHAIDLSSLLGVRRIGGAAAKCSNQADLHLAFIDLI
jgi:hypothetical protein